MFKNLNEHDDNDLKKQNHEKRTDIIYKEKQNENNDERVNN